MWRREGLSKSHERYKHTRGIGSRSCGSRLRSYNNGGKAAYEEVARGMAEIIACCSPQHVGLVEERRGWGLNKIVSFLFCAVSRCLSSTSDSTVVSYNTVSCSITYLTFLVLRMFSFLHLTHFLSSPLLPFHLSPETP